MSNCVYAQQNQPSPQNYSELKEWGIKGKIKTITQYRFDCDLENIDRANTLETLNWKDKTLVYYNKFGNVEQLKIFLKDSLGKEYLEGEINYKFSEIGSMGFYIKNTDTLTTYLKSWVDANTYKVQIYSGKKLATESIVNLKEDFLASRQSDIYYENDEPHFSSNRYYFDELKNLNKIESEDIANKTSEFSKHFIYDKIGNPLKTLKTNEDSQDSILIIKKYTYYPE